MYLLYTCCGSGMNLLAGFSACLLSHQTAALLACTSEPPLEDCPAQGENGCPETSPFLKEG